MEKSLQFIIQEQIFQVKIKTGLSLVSGFEPEVYRSLVCRIYQLCYTKFSGNCSPAL